MVVRNGRPKRSSETVGFRYAFLLLGLPLFKRSTRPFARRIPTTVLAQHLGTCSNGKGCGRFGHMAAQIAMALHGSNATAGERNPADQLHSLLCSKPSSRSKSRSAHAGQPFFTMSAWYLSAWRLSVLIDLVVCVSALLSVCRWLCLSLFLLFPVWNLFVPSFGHLSARRAVWMSGWLCLTNSIAFCLHVDLHPCMSLSVSRRLCSCRSVKLPRYLLMPALA
jgi:hypothetical protein